jgi:CBS-domain-containing membrane protein
MNIEAICTLKVVTVDHATPLRTAARLMRDRHIGALIVTGIGDGRAPVVGIVTDRDLVIDALARDLDPGTVTVGDLGSTDVVAIPAIASVGDAIATMREEGIRRLLVVDGAQQVVGIVTLDDLVEALAVEMADLAEALRSGPAREAASHAEAEAPRPTTVLSLPPESLAARWRSSPAA